MSLTRRQLLKTGAAGVVLLTLADCARRATGVSPDERAIVRAIADAMLDGAIPASGAGRERALDLAVDGFVTAVDGLPPDVQRRVQQVFGLLSFAPTRLLLAGLPSWNGATRDDVATFLTRWRFSGLSLLRSAYDALHQLIMAGWYGQEASWAHIGYPGPPRITA